MVPRYGTLKKGFMDCGILCKRAAADRAAEGVCGEMIEEAEDSDEPVSELKQLGGVEGRRAVCGFQ